MRARPKPLSAGGRRTALFLINDLALGGAQRVVVNQAASLDRQRFRVEIASLEIVRSASHETLAREGGLTVHRLRCPGEPLLASWPRLLALVRSMRPELLHTHLAAAGVAGRLAARLSGVPRLVCTLHNLTDWEEKRANPLRWLDRRTLVMCDRIIAVSDAVRAAFERECPGLATRAVTVHNGVALDRLAGARPTRAAAREGLGYAPSDFVVGAVARLERRKGIDTLVDAFARAAELDARLRLLLVGEGPERAALQGSVRAHGLEARVRFTGDQPEVGRWLAAMDLFAAPSRTEGLGVAIIEALAAGVPVVASRVGGIPEVVEDGVCGRLLPPAQIASWAEALDQLAHAPELLERWSREGPARAARFSLAASARALERIYDQLLDTSDVEAEKEVA